MALKKFFFSPFHTDKLKLFLIFTIIIPFTQAFSFKYPNAITLKNKKIFVIHSLGIDICDSLYKTNSKVLEFEEELTKSDLSKIIISKYSSGEFIVLIINKIYIFDEYGEKILFDNVDESFNAEYFTLSAHKITKSDDNNYFYYFLLGFINKDNLKLNFYYYCLDTNSESINIISLLNNYNDDFKNTGLSCKFIIYGEIEYILCIYEVKKSVLLVGWDNDIIFRFFEIGYDNSIIFVTNKNYDKLNLKYIWSPSKSIDSKVFFCGITTNDKSICLMYSYDDINYALIYDNGNTKQCLNTPYNIKTYYFQETSEYVFSCLTKDKGIQTTIYKENMNLVNIENPSKRLQRTFGECDEFYYSIIYSEIKQKYYIVSDMSCITCGKIFPLIEEDDDEYCLLDEDNNYEIAIEEIEEEKYLEEEFKLEMKGGMYHLDNEGEIEKEIEYEIYQKEEEKENGLKYEEELPKEERLEECKLNSTEIEQEQEQEQEKKEIENIKEIEKDIYHCNLEKCSECNEQSKQLNLCIKCNIEKEYYPINLEDILESKEYIDCYNSITKPQGFYFDENDKDYKLCYSLCKTCNFGGDGNENNCTSCKNDLIFRPDIPNSSNCVIKCPYYYYYQKGLYKCTNTENCPDNYQLEINEKKKCIEKCEKDNMYKIQYDGECYKETPEGTAYDSVKKISKDIDIVKCTLNEKKLKLISNENITEYEIKAKAKLYAEEFDYTNNHITLYKNDFYSITIYKYQKCLSELNLNIDEIDFGNCYKKIQDELGIEENLIIVIISKIINNISFTIDHFIFNPKSGEKINHTEICKDEILIIQKNLKEQIKNTENFESIENLVKQGIDIFDPKDDFYTDLCFHFKSPIDGKDIPVKDRYKLFYKNITLCDEGCKIKGVNLTTWKAVCECTLSNLVHNNILGNNLFVQKTFGEVQDILTKTNVEVLKCYKDIFDKEMYKTNIGLYIILAFICIIIAFIFIYYFINKIKIQKYVLAITDQYLYSLYNKKNSELINNPFKNEEISKCSPPKNNLVSEFKLKSGNIINHENKNFNNKSHKQIIARIKGDVKKTTKKINMYKKLSSKNNFSISKDIKQNSNDIINAVKNMELKEKEYHPIIPNFNNRININIEEFIKTDLDDMDYDDAIRKDKRTYCQYFSDRIKTEQIILSTFFKYEILKPISIKIILLIINFDLYLIVNGLFFNENYISDLLHSSSDTIYSFINRILDRIIIITITGIIINYIIEFFFVKENKLKKIFKIEGENSMKLKYEVLQIIKNIYIRYNIFIIISGILLVFSLYYIFCFNNVYPCIKMEWLKSSLIIIAIMQILPIFLCFLDASIRFISFRCKSERLYKLSAMFT